MWRCAATWVTGVLAKRCWMQKWWTRSLREAETPRRALCSHTRQAAGAALLCLGHRLLQEDPLRQDCGWGGFHCEGTSVPGHGGDFTKHRNFLLLKALGFFWLQNLSAPEIQGPLGGLMWWPLPVRNSQASLCSSQACGLTPQDGQQPGITIKNTLLSLHCFLRKGPFENIICAHSENIPREQLRWGAQPSSFPA